MKIFIDPGHNYSGADTGATGNGLREQDVTYNVALKLSSLLQNSGVEVKMSRNKITDNVGTSLSTSLSKRALLANNWKADYFISLHCDSWITSSPKGSHICICGKGGMAEKLANSINPHLLKLGLGGRSELVSVRKDLAVLNKTNMPAILIEMGFITNPLDAKLHKDGVDKLANAIFNGLRDCLDIQQKVVIEDKKPITDKPEKFKYHIEGITHVIEIDPRQIWAVETQCATNKTPYDNFVNSIFFMAQDNGIMYPQGIMVNAGEVIANNPTHGKPVATLIVYGKDNVQLKYIDDITKEKNVWFAISGYGIYPNITADKEGFVGKFSDVTRTTNRPIIGYRKKDNKIVIAVRSNSDVTRASQTAKNLGLDFAISLDGGGSTTLKVNGEYKFKGDGRKIFGGIIWA